MNNESKLLMNIHKVEKAISMPNRYPVFSQKIIEKIIDTLNNKNNLSEDIKKTALETIKKYINCLDLTYNENIKIVDFINNNLNLKEIIFIKNINKEKHEQFSILENIAQNRHSVRNFSDKKFSYELIEKSLIIANSLPTPCNRQSCSLMVIENELIKNKILNLQEGNKGFYAPVLAAILVDLSAFTQDNEKNAPYFHAGSFTAGLVLGLETMQLSSCVLNWHVNEQTNKEVKTLLNLKEKEITAFIFIGYAKEGKEEAYSFKKNSKNLLEIIK